MGIPETYLGLLTRIAVASFLGGLIGLERDIHGRDAGLRTHLLVCMGASAFMVLSELVSLPGNGSGGLADSRGRIAAQIVTGIGFLGAGVIIKSGVTIRGLTTAACLWTTAAIGMASGGGYYWIAFTTTGLALISLIAMKPFERLYSKDSYRILRVTTPIDVEAGEVSAILEALHLKILNYDIHRNYDEGFSVLQFSIRIFQRDARDDTARHIIQSLESSSLVLKELRWHHS
ncbi:MAG: MgtC/SapB family protein [Nitrospiria bacterium]